MILVANPGSASRKYALFEDATCRASLHFEFEASQLICTFEQRHAKKRLEITISDIKDTAKHITPLFESQGALKSNESIERVGLRIVAPGSYFLQDRLMNDEAVGQLRQFAQKAPIHIQATLEELENLREHFASTPIIGISDSGFHASKPDRAWNYGLPLYDADRFEIKRFGYHGLSVASVIETLKQARKLAPKVIVAHLGSGASISALYHGKSTDNTMGYSPLEGLVMSTRVGSLDLMAAHALKHELSFGDAALEQYLHEQSGLRGLGGSDDIRELLGREANGDHQAKLALDTYIFNIQKAIGQMSAALGGVDVLVFTGTIGERSALVRERILNAFNYLDLHFNASANNRCMEPTSLTLISQLAKSKPIFVAPNHEAAQIAQQAKLIAL